ncbi:MAG TPA: sulfite exporter TauE/SafE family protein [Phnomibacter sp.]|nr:sulfite exporter TauE/SafE family protein [Phnomibacter sp.]
MFTVVTISAFLLGFAGSFHCMGMCGPIALGISGRGASGIGWLHHLLYFIGKTFTYTLLGLVFGIFGQGLVLAGLQQALSITMGGIMLLLVAVSLFRASWFHQNVLTLWVQDHLLPIFGRLLHRHGLSSSMGLGMLNGLLPCGLVYIGLTAAVATGMAWYAAWYMLVFGLGTIPVMFSFLVFTRQLGYQWRVRLRQLTPVLMAVVGTILVLRGMNLGIPYLSPLMDALSLTGDRGAEAAGCHP